MGSKIGAISQYCLCETLQEFARQSRKEFLAEKEDPLL